MSHDMQLAPTVNQTFKRICHLMQDIARPYTADFIRTKIDELLNLLVSRGMARNFEREEP